MKTSVDVEYQPISSVSIDNADPVSVDVITSNNFSIELSLTNIGPPGITTVGTLEDLTDVDTETKLAGQFLYYDGSEWKPANLDGGTFN